MLLPDTSYELFLTKCLPSKNADFFFFVFPSYECSKFHNALIVQSQRGFLVQMWDPASSKTSLCDCALCRSTDIREFIPGVILEKQGK